MTLVEKILAGETLTLAEERRFARQTALAHTYLWTLRGKIDDRDGSVTITLLELKSSSETYRVKKTFLYDRTQIEALLREYPITSLYQQPARESQIRANYDAIRRSLHLETDDVVRDGWGRTKEVDGLFINERCSSDPQVRPDLAGQVKEMVDSFVLLHVFKNVNYDDYYGFLVTDMYGKTIPASHPA